MPHLESNGRGLDHGMRSVASVRPCLEICGSKHDAIHDSYIEDGLFMNFQGALLFVLKRM
jgi:hypothetical protein